MASLLLVLGQENEGLEEDAGLGDLLCSPIDKAVGAHLCCDLSSAYFFSLGILILFFFFLKEFVKFTAAEQEGAILELQPCSYRLRVL